MGQKGNMRRSVGWIFILTLILSFRVEAQTYWTSLTPATDKDLHRVFFLDSLTGWTVGEGGTILKTTNGAQSWVVQNSKITSSIGDIFMLDTLRGWALSQTLPGVGWYGTLILTTTDGGGSWSKSQYPDTGQYMYSICYLDSLHGWMAGEYGRMVGTSDGGQTWSPATVDTLFPFAIRRIKFFSPLYGVAVGGVRDVTAVIWQTTSGGEVWSARRIGSEPLNDLFFKDSLTVISVGGDFEFGATVVKTTNGGVDWEYNFVGFFGVGGGVAFRTAAEGWSPLGFSGSIMYTLDSAQTWQSMEVPNRSYVYDVAFTDERNGFMIGLAGAILKYNPVAGVRRQPEPGIPAENILYQSYPNPFNPTTEIGYQISEVSHVTLIVYNLLGQSVATLVQQEMMPGKYTVTWDAGSFPAGMYFCRLLAGTQRMTRKMILLK